MHIIPLNSDRIFFTSIATEFHILPFNCIRINLLSVLDCMCVHKHMCAESCQQHPSGIDEVETKWTCDKNTRLNRIRFTLLNHIGITLLTLLSRIRVTVQNYCTRQVGFH